MSTAVTSVLAGPLLWITTACSATQCLMPGSQPPSRAKVLANLTGGQPAREAMAAVFDGNVDVVRRIVAADRRVLDTKVTYDSYSRPDGQWGDLLTIAVAQCDEEMARALLDLGASPNGADYGRPLATAVQTRTPDMAALLLDAGADPDPAAKGGEDVIDVALSFGGKGAVMMLLRHGLDPNRQHEVSGDTALWTAIAMERYEIAELLMDHGANPWIVNRDGGSAAWTLARGGPIVFGGEEQEASRRRLIERAKLPGVPWPPPDLPEMRRMVLAGEWPTPAAKAAGVPDVSERTLADMREYYSADGSRRAGK